MIATKVAKLIVLQMNSSPDLYACCLRIRSPRSSQHFMRNHKFQPEFFLYSQHLWFLEQAQFRLREHKLWHSKIKTVQNETANWYLDARKKPIITLIHEFEHRGESMLMAKKRFLDVVEGNVSNWLNKTNQFQWGNLPQRIKLTENLMEAFRLIVTAKIDFSRRSTSNLIPIP